MKLEPVYVLAPRPAAPAMPTRRAFLFAGAAFLGGAAAGSAGGWWFGTRSVPEGTGAEAAPSADENIIWLHGLCHDASPIDELVRRRVSLYFAVARSGSDPILWHGFERLCREVQDNPLLDKRRQIADELSQTLSEDLVRTYPRARAAQLRYQGSLQVIREGR